MLFPSILSTLCLSILASVALGQNCSTSAQKGSPSLTKFLTATLNVGPPNAPIDIPGGIKLVETYTGGKLTSSAFSGTVLGGIGTPRVYGGGSSIYSDLTLYGTTEDGLTFLLEVAGNGNGSSTFSRIQLEIAGQYASYSNKFILGVAFVSADRKTVTAEGYLPSL